MEQSGNSWETYGVHVLEELKRLNTSVSDLHKEVEYVKTEIAGLKVKASLWGALAGMVPVVITLAILALRGHI